MDTQAGVFTESLLSSIKQTSTTSRQRQIKDSCEGLPRCWRDSFLSEVSQKELKSLRLQQDWIQTTDMSSIGPYPPSYLSPFWWGSGPIFASSLLDSEDREDSIVAVRLQHGQHFLNPNSKLKRSGCLFCAGLSYSTRKSTPNPQMSEVSVLQEETLWVEGVRLFAATAMLRCCSKKSWARLACLVL